MQSTVPRPPQPAINVRSATLREQTDGRRRPRDGKIERQIGRRSAEQGPRPIGWHPVQMVQWRTEASRPSRRAPRGFGCRPLDVIVRSSLRARMRARGLGERRLVDRARQRRDDGGNTSSRPSSRTAIAWCSVRCPSRASAWRRPQAELWPISLSRLGGRRDRARGFFRRAFRSNARFGAFSARPRGVVTRMRRSAGPIDRVGHTPPT